MRVVRPFIVGVALFALGCSATPPADTAAVVEATPSVAPRQRLPNGDRDRDGVSNANDACPLLPEDVDQIDDADGCPEEDADGDGVADNRDACPKEPGSERSDPGQNGCPYLHRVIPDETIVIVPRVHFGYGDASNMDPNDAPILHEIASTMQAHPEITKLEVQGDASTDEADPVTLGQSRAKKVVDALVQLGVAAERLVAKSYGSTRPVVDNTTTERRAENRRVGFLILEHD